MHDSSARTTDPYHWAHSLCLYFAPPTHVYFLSSSSMTTGTLTAESSAPKTALNKIGAQQILAEWVSEWKIFMVYYRNYQVSVGPFLTSTSHLALRYCIYFNQIKFRLLFLSLIATVITTNWNSELWQSLEVSIFSSKAWLDRPSPLLPPPANLNLLDTVNAVQIS